MDLVSSPACQVPHTHNELSSFFMISSSTTMTDLIVWTPILVRIFALRSVDN